MIVVTHRPEFAPPWLDLAHATVLKLNQLGRSQVVELIHRAVRGKTLPQAIIEQIASKSQGVPLFIEEIAGDFGSVIWKNPETVTSCDNQFESSPFRLHYRDSLIARLDRLGSAKDVVLTASIIGREFSYELIEAVSSVPQAALLADLGRLVQSDLLEQRGTPPQSRYIFNMTDSHAASQSVLKTRKRELHQRLAEVFTSRFPEVVANEPNCWRTTTRKQI